MGVRREIMSDPEARKAFVDGVLALKEENSGITTAQLGIPGSADAVSTYDLFIVWHHLAMGRMTPPGQADRNAAHSGPAFLPWHRLMLLLLEMQVQRVLGSPDFGVPYWDWAADGELAPGEQPQTPLWSDAGIGGSGDTVGDGPFRGGEFEVRLVSDGVVRLVKAGRPLTRRLGVSPMAPTLPTVADVATTLGLDEYDAFPWNSSSGEFRNVLEGWPNGPSLHNRVHVWIGGDMGIASSPNDPVFFLNHANVDRIWQAWMRDHGEEYLPDSAAPTTLLGHRRDDPLYSILISEVVTPTDVLDVGAFYAYDDLP
ncbi:tyrosinase family protein [Actinomycetospora sp. CA-101289]|uniref:tyrosinase family protein n=1 Tax=Actinomycetospora sp. CA-101289 TaxID=3239893 RepID=UPI003D972864